MNQKYISGVILLSLLIFSLQYCAPTDMASYYYTETQISNEDLGFHHQLRVNEYINAFEQPELSPPVNEPVKLYIDPFFSRQSTSQPILLMQVAVRTREILPEEKREPMCLSFVLDVSGSMRLNDKLPVVKDALIQGVHALRPGDEFALVTFESTAQTIISPTSISEKNRATIIETIRNLKADGSTNIQDGLLLGYNELARFEKSGHKRLILLTDGNSNVEVMTPEAMARRLEIAAVEEARISTIGLGYDVDQPLLRSIAKAGGGHFYFADKVETLEGYLKSDLQSTVIPVLQDVEISLQTLPGYRMEKVYGGDYTNQISPEKAIVSVGDMNVDDWRIIMVELQNLSPQEGGSRPLTASIHGYVTSSREPVSYETTSAITWTGDPSDASLPNPSVVRNSVILGNAETLIQIGRLSEQAQYNEALQILDLQIQNNILNFELTGSDDLASEYERLQSIREILHTRTQNGRIAQNQFVRTDRSLHPDTTENLTEERSAKVRQIADISLDIADQVLPGIWTTIARLFGEVIFPE